MSLMRGIVSDPRGWARACAAGLAALALLVAVSFLPMWHALEYKSFDLFSTLTASGRARSNIVIVGIDEPSFQHLQHAWPFPRQWHAQLIQRLQADGARAVAFDVVFADPGRESEDAALARAIEQAAPHMPVVLASTRERVDSPDALLWTQVQPLRRLLEAGAIAGDAVVEPDADFVVRRAASAKGSLATTLAALVAGDASSGRAPDWLAYRGPRGTFDTRSYYQALEPQWLPAGFFRDKIVLVGRSAVTGVDLFNAPVLSAEGVRTITGVELHATLLDNLLAGDGLQATPEAWRWWLVWLALPLMVWVGHRWHPAAGAAAAAAWVLAVAALSWGAFAYYRLWLPPLLPALTGAVVFGATSLVGYAATRQRAQRVRAMFAQYVPEQVVARLVAQSAALQLGGQEREITLMFTDLANFTTLSEALTPEQTLDVLNEYFAAMTPLIHATDGTIDKFIGDAIMAFWGAPLDDPQQAVHAVTSALQMQQAMQGLAQRLQARGLPTVQMRIGIHTGRAVVGNVGTLKRMAFTAVGDAVNLAARLEGANKAFGTGILLSHSTARAVQGAVALRPLDDVIVKGKTEPVRVYTPCAQGGRDAQLAHHTAAALDALHAHRWDEAHAHVQALLQLRPDDVAGLRLQERLAQGRCATGEGWSAAVALDKL